MKVRFFTKGNLSTNRLLDSKVLSSLDDELRYPVVSHMMHNDGESVRCIVALSEFRRTMITVPTKLFNGLGTVDLDISPLDRK